MPGPWLKPVDGFGVAGINIGQFDFAPVAGNQFFPHRLSRRMAHNLVIPGQGIAFQGSGSNPDRTLGYIVAVHVAAVEIQNAAIFGEGFVDPFSRGGAYLFYKRIGNARVGNEVSVLGNVHDVQQVHILFQNFINMQFVFVLKTRILLKIYPAQIMIVMVPQAEFYPGVGPGNFAEFPEITELPEKGHVQAVKIIAGKIKPGKIFIQVFFPVGSAVDVSTRQSHGTAILAKISQTGEAPAQGSGMYFFHLQIP
jgi:hypothetical protein